MDIFSRERARSLLIDNLEDKLRFIVKRNITEEKLPHDFTGILKVDDIEKIKGRCDDANLVDCLLFSELLSIIHHPDTWDLWKDLFTDVFFGGREHAVLVFKQLIKPRNKLAHAKHMSDRELEKVICYSRDIIDSIRNNMSEKEDNPYNSPLITKFTDSLGNSYVRESYDEHSIFQQLRTESVLYPGDELEIVVSIDLAFQEDFEVTTSRRSAKLHTSKSESKATLICQIKEEDIGPRLHIMIRTKAKRPWHRIDGSLDDLLRVSYKVMPEAYRE